MQLESFSSSDQGHLELKIGAELHVYDCNVGNAEDICKLAHDYAAHALLEAQRLKTEKVLLAKREAAEAAKLPSEKEERDGNGRRKKQHHRSKTKR